MNTPTITLILATLNTGYDTPIDLVQAGCVTVALYHEAASEPLQGKAAVAQVIINRMRERRQTACEVVYDPYQFSFTLLDPETLLERESRSDAATQLALWESATVALQALSNGIAMHEATHYYNPSLVSPKWAASFDNELVVGGHRFVW